MQPRRSLRLLAGALVLAVPLLGGCGFNKATDKVYTPAAGVNNRTGEVDVLSAVVVAAQPNSGTFIATLSNNSATDEDSLESVAPAAGTSDNTTKVTDLSFDAIPEAIAVPPRGFINMADNQLGVPVTGNFNAGDFLSVTLTFSSGETSSLKIPVVYACDEWKGLDTSLDGTATAGASPSASASPSSTASSTASAAAAPGTPYDCSEDLYDTASSSPSASD